MAVVAGATILALVSACTSPTAPAATPRSAIDKGVIWGGPNNPPTPNGVTWGGPNNAPKSNNEWQ
jgi:hypothetical protein